MLVELDGATLNYEISGNAEKPWLTFSNSLATDLHMWDEQEKSLGNDFHILRYDKRGHGKSKPVEGPYSFDDLIGDVVGLWDHLGIEKSYFVGLSIGGMTAQGLLLKYPERVVATVMANTMAQCVQTSIWEDRVNVVREQGLESVVTPTLERWFTEGYRNTGASRIDDVRAMIRNTSVAGYTGCACAIQTLDYLHQLASLDHPVLLIAGTHDAGTPVAGMQLMHEHIPNSEYVELPAAHISNIEREAEFTSQVKSFFSQH